MTNGLSLTRGNERLVATEIVDVIKEPHLLKDRDGVGAAPYAFGVVSDGMLPGETHDDVDAVLNEFPLVVAGELELLSMGQAVRGAFVPALGDLLGERRRLLEGFAGQERRHLDAAAIEHVEKPRNALRQPYCRSVCVAKSGQLWLLASGGTKRASICGIDSEPDSHIIEIVIGKRTPSGQNAPGLACVDLRRRRSGRLRECESAAGCGAAGHEGAARQAAGRARSNFVVVIHAADRALSLGAGRIIRTDEAQQKNHDDCPSVEAFRRAELVYFPVTLRHPPLRVIAQIGFKRLKVDLDALRARIVTHKRAVPRADLGDRNHQPPRLCRTRLCLRRLQEEHHASRLTNSTLRDRRNQQRQLALREPRYSATAWLRTAP